MDDFLFFVDCFIGFNVVVFLACLVRMHVKHFYF